MLIGQIILDLLSDYLKTFAHLNLILSCFCRHTARFKNLISKAQDFLKFLTFTHDSRTSFKSDRCLAVEL